MFGSMQTFIQIGCSLFTKLILIHRQKRTIHYSCLLFLFFFFFLIPSFGWYQYNYLGFCANGTPSNLNVYVQKNRSVFWIFWCKYKCKIFTHSIQFSGERGKGGRGWGGGLFMVRWYGNCHLFSFCNLYCHCMYKCTICEKKNHFKALLFHVLV